MAKTLKKFEFKTGIGGESSYDWDSWLDGRIWQLEEGEGKDFDCKVATFSTLARNAGRKRGLTVSINTVEGGVVIQAKPATDEQKAAWEAQDEERKAKAKQKRKDAKAGANGEETGDEPE